MAQWRFNASAHSRLPEWIARPRKAWAFLAVVLACFVAADWTGSCFGTPRIERLVWAGWALELASVLQIVAGIWQREKRFGRPSLLTQFREWLSQ